MFYSFLGTKGVSCRKCVGISTDRALSMVGSRRGYNSYRIKKILHLPNKLLFCRELLVPKPLRLKIAYDATKRLPFIEQKLVDLSTFKKNA